MIISHSHFFGRLMKWLDIAPVFIIESLMPAVDYRRYMWAQRMDQPLRSDRWPDHYFNSGFVAGVFERDQALIKAWDETIRRMLAPPADVAADEDFPYPDQDALNVVLQNWNAPLIGIGRPDIWAAHWQTNPFLHVGTFDKPVVLHGSLGLKPWMIRTIPGRAPNPYESAWYELAVRNPEPMSVSTTFGPLLTAWFDQNPVGRIAQVAQRAMSRIIRRKNLFEYRWNASVRGTPLASNK